MNLENQTVASIASAVFTTPSPVSGLSIAPGVSLPTETITARNGIFGISGSGKTYSASDVAEEMLAAFMHVVVFDPLGVWWGLASVPSVADKQRDEAEGQGPVNGTPLYIFGGDHADVPLNPSSGAAIADLIVQDGLSVVLDMSGFDDDAQMATFVAAFSTRLLKINKEALHVFIDEADLFVPETSGSKEEAASRKAVDNMVRRGRKGGIGTTLISQRPAVVSKNVLSQCTTLIVHQLTGAADQSAMAKWFGDHGTVAEQKEVTGSLSSLGRGEAWIFTPGLQQLVRATMRKRRTFDSSATPKFGEKPIVPRRLAAPDLSALRERLAVQVEAEKENDVDLLKGKVKEQAAQIVQLNAELKARPAGEPKVVTEIVEKIVYVEVPVFKDGEAERLQDDMIGLAKDLVAMSGGIKAARDLSKRLTAERGGEGEEAKVGVAGEATEANVVSPPAPVKTVHEPKAAYPASVPMRTPTKTTLTGPQQKILDALATFDRLGRAQTERALVGVWSGYSATSGTFRNYLGELKGKGLISLIAPDRLEITQDGRAVARPDVPKLDSLQTLHAAWYARLTGPQEKLQRVLVRHYPQPLTRDLLAMETGYSATSGTFRNYMGELKGLGIAEFPNPRTIRATALMFPSELVNRKNR